MKSFTGFPEGRVSYTPVPDLFFIDLVPPIDNLAELKLTLYLFWALYHQEGSPRYITLSELESEGTLLSGLPTGQDETPVAALHKAVEQAVKRGTVLQLQVANAEKTIQYIFLNTPQGRRAIREVKEGKLVLESEGRVIEAHIQRPRPSIYELYEQNIGILTPLIGEQITEACSTYPEQWIHEAVKIAVERNARNWRYIDAILKRWSTNGKS